jgi:hypothetical protein
LDKNLTAGLRFILLSYHGAIVWPMCKSSLEFDLVQTKIIAYYPYPYLCQIRIDCFSMLYKACAVQSLSDLKSQTSFRTFSSLFCLIGGHI